MPPPPSLCALLPPPGGPEHELIGLAFTDERWMKWDPPRRNNWLHSMCMHVVVGGGAARAGAPGAGRGGAHQCFGCYRFLFFLKNHAGFAISDGLLLKKSKRTVGELIYLYMKCCSDQLHHGYKTLLSFVSVLSVWLAGAEFQAVRLNQTKQQEQTHLCNPCHLLRCCVLGPVFTSCQSQFPPVWPMEELITILIIPIA